MPEQILAGSPDDIGIEMIEILNIEILKYLAGSPDDIGIEMIE